MPLSKTVNVRALCSHDWAYEQQKRTLEWREFLLQPVDVYGIFEQTILDYIDELPKTKPFESITNADKKVHEPIRREYMQKNTTTVKIEIVTHQRELPSAISEHYGVAATKIAETPFYTIFVLETHESGGIDSGTDLLAELEAKREIICHAWSRPVRVKGYSGPELREHLRRKLLSFSSLKERK